MPKFLIGGIVFLLLLGAGYGLAQAARSIPWDCADWQAFAHEDRTTAILESLAENRGKTLYCGIDQSDTFAKAETWEAGKDRNERDDTVYFGERGQFRGFIAAQEGWLTDGESGVTGVSIDRIFEFPREERRGRRSKVKRLEVTICQWEGDDFQSCSDTGAEELALRVSSYGQAGDGGCTVYPLSKNDYLDNGCIWQFGQWQSLAAVQAQSHCRSLGYPRAQKVVVDGQHIGNPDTPSNFYAWAGTNPFHQERAWRATCVKKVRGPRRG